MVRTVTSVLALLVATQAAAFSEARAVCRFTGRTIAPCPCPEVHHAAPPVDAVEAASCCLVQQGRLPGLPDARLTGSSAVFVAQLPAVEVVTVAPLFAVTTLRPVLRHDEGPPRLYVTLRQLLL